jgi:cell division septum initiation protein DivIVA
MSFLENLALVGTAAIILGVFLTGYAIVNNKILKKESKLTREVLAETIEKESKLTREAIAEESKLTREAIEKESKLTREAIIEESRLTREMIAQETSLVREMIKEIAEYLGNLIVAEGDRTRKSISSGK